MTKTTNKTEATPHKKLSPRSNGQWPMPFPQHYQIQVASLFDGSKLHDGPLQIEVKSGRIQSITVEKKSSDIPTLDMTHLNAIPLMAETHAHLYLNPWPLVRPRSPKALSNSDALNNSNQSKNPDLLALARKHSIEYLKSGIGTVRDMGDPTALNIQLRNDFRKTSNTLTLKACGQGLFSPGRYGRILGKATSPEDLDSVIRERITKDNVDFIKLIPTGIVNFNKKQMSAPPSYSLPQIQSVVRVAHENGLKVAAHCSGAEGLDRCIAAGVDFIEHAYFGTPEHLKQMRDKAMFWTPTFTPVYVQWLHAEACGWDQNATRNLKEIIDSHMELLAKARDLEVQVLAGSDAGSPGVGHGGGLLHELTLLEKVFSPLEVMQIATARNHAALGLPEDGTIRVGQEAKLAFYEQQPAESIEALRKPAWILSGSELIKAQESKISDQKILETPEAIASNEAVTFTLPDGRTQCTALRSEESVAEAAIRQGFDLRMSCGGQGACRTCEMQKEGVRLRSCQATTGGSYEIPITSRYDNAAQIETASIWERDEAAKSVAHVLSLAMPPGPQLKALEFLESTLAGAGFSNVDIPSQLAEQTQALLDANDSRAIPVFGLLLDFPDSLKLVAVAQTAAELPVYAVAVDIGTTTLVAELVDTQTGQSLGKASCGNAQIRMAEDVAARISVSKGKVQMMQDLLVRSSLWPLIARLAVHAKINRKRIGMVSISANTVMNHLLLGWDPEGLGAVPFTAVSLAPPIIPCQSLGMKLAPHACLVVIPSMSAYVGGDLTSGAVVTGLFRSKKTAALIDVGTNGEILLIHKGKMFGCATPAGPAFEGAGLRCGVRARVGAIEHIRLTATTLAFDLIRSVDASIAAVTPKPIGICGSACLDILGQGLMAGVINKSGRLKKGHPNIEEYVTDDRKLAKRLLIASADQTPDGYDAIYITEAEISELLQAKAAVFSGLVTLTQSVGISIAQIEEVFLCGGFARHVDLASAVAAGLLPDGPELKVVGNTSLSGAIAVLLDDAVSAQMNEVSTSVKIIELNFQPAFEENFVNALFLPNRDRTLFPNISVPSRLEQRRAKRRARQKAAEMEADVACRLVGKEAL